MQEIRRNALMGFKNLKLDRDNKILIITINRPQVLNALNTETLKELREALEYACQNSTIRVIIITGSGEKSFSAGADINELKNLTPLEAWNFMILGQEVFNKIENLEKPVIAAVNGYALGGGLELALSCDIIIACKKAKFGHPEINLGNIPGWGGTQRLPRLIGCKLAKQMILTGDIIDADTASKIGLVNEVVDKEELMEAAKKLAHKLSLKAPIAVKLAKWAINRSLDTNLTTGLAFERVSVAFCFTTKDQREALNAFFEKRRPIFKGK